MRIISPFKDYYDYVAHAYGRGDPKVTYVRNTLATPDLQHQRIELPPNPCQYRWASKDDPFSGKWLAVAGNLYLLVSWYRMGEPEHWQIADPAVTEPDLWEVVERITDRKYWWGESVYKDQVKHKMDARILELFRTVGQPVFIFNGAMPYPIESMLTLSDNKGNNWLQVERQIPNLGQLGMAKILPAEQCYQDIAYFVGNMLHENPDQSPRSEMSDKEKIESHGFDKRISFRHRV